MAYVVSLNQLIVILGGFFFCGPKTVNKTNLWPAKNTMDSLIYYWLQAPVD